ncbi:IclR family transcriptional regulator [Paraburkholderia sediminicola]|uniref:IclR family transcriptional regulator n=1 Tax=Paraburkholderia sediminicola TaxID=458836 RepID=UPI0038B92169
MGLKEADRHVESVMAALALLESFEEDRSLRLKDFHERTGMQKSRILRLLGSLQAAGFLAEDSESAGFRLGPKVMALGRLVSETYLDLAGRVQPSLSRITKELGDTSFLSVVRGLQRMVLAQKTPEDGLCFAIPDGQLRPLHAGATGKILLSFGPVELRRRVLAGELVGLTSETRTVPSVLEEELELVRQAGHAVSRGEATPHSYAISVPVVRAGALLGAITVAGPRSKLDFDYEAHAIDLMHGEVEQILRSLT